MAGTYIGHADNVFTLPRGMWLPFSGAREEIDWNELRRVLLGRMRRLWIDGVLDPSFEELAPMQLELETRPDAIAQSFAGVIPRPARSPARLSPGLPIDGVFDESDGALLILGAPGSGKTTLLLQLARQLIARAEAQPEHRIPVVFPLSTWATLRKPLAEWLVDTLQEHYRLSRRHCQAYVQTDRILPLLDGLDEVPAEHRFACAQQIAAFRTHHDLVPMVVCSRVAEYESLGVQLPLDLAVVVQPLTAAQVDDSLTHADPPLLDLVAALDADVGLRELADTPLMLTILAASYDGYAANVPRDGESLEQQRARLFATYVNHMFERRPMPSAFTPAQTLNWLAWLAGAMRAHNLSVFHLESLQWDWAMSERQHTAAGYGAAMVFALLAAGLAIRVGGDLIAAAIMAFVFFSLGRGVLSRRIRPIERLSWSWSKARHGSTGLVTLLLLGTYLIISVVAIILKGGTENLLSGLTSGLALGLGSGLVALLAAGVQTSDASSRLTPNEAIRRSARSALIAGLAAGTFVAVLSAVGIGALYLTMDVPIFLAAIVGMTFGLIGGGYAAFEYGGRACIEHLLVRGLLSRKGVAPWAYPDFLDFAVERVLLRRVGGGYIFLHRLLLEYFADLDR